MIFGGRTLQLSSEEYICGALQLYIDVCGLFLMILGFSSFIDWVNVLRCTHTVRACVSRARWPGKLGGQTPPPQPRRQLPVTFSQNRWVSSEVISYPRLLWFRPSWCAKCDMKWKMFTWMWPAYKTCWLRRCGWTAVDDARLECENPADSHGL